MKNISSTFLQKQEQQMTTVVNNISVGSIRPSCIHGNGLFALRPIHFHELLAVLDGQIVPWKIYQDSHAEFVEWNALPKDQLLCRSVRTKYSFINHSRKPNLLVQIEFPFVKLIATRNICEGEEFFLDYRKEPFPKEYLSGHGATYL